MTEYSEHFLKVQLAKIKKLDAKIQPLQRDRSIILQELYYAYGKDKIDKLIKN
jgi:hypothetical protein